MRAWFARMLAMSLILVVAACGSGPTPAGLDAGPAAVAQMDVGSYVLGPGDKLRVTTFGEETLTGEFTVAGNGVVSMPLVGDVAAQGATVAEFRDRFVEALKDGYLLDPRVTVEVLNYRPFFVLGEVSRPGEYPYTNGLTVLNAVATAGGFTYRANTRRVYIKHQDQASEREYALTAETRVSPGDTIRIGERYF